MIKPHRLPVFLKGYRFLPHHALNRAAQALARAQWPRWAVDATVQLWIRRGHIPMGEFSDGPYPCVEDFFLRRLKPGARPIGPGLACPQDGLLYGSGWIEQGTLLTIKGERLSANQLINGDQHQADLTAYEGGVFATFFLTPDGYHYIHAPCDAVLTGTQWVPGRYFPQNADALGQISNVYGRNERVTLFFSTREGHTFALTLIGASMIGGIHLTGYSRSQWAQSTRLAHTKQVSKGEELGYFSFGSTVVIWMPSATGLTPLSAPEQTPFKMGETLWSSELK